MRRPDDSREMAPEEENLCLTEILSILQSDLRRDVLTCLQNADNRTISTDELVEHLLERREMTERTDLAIRLHHIHLPKLAEANLIEFEPRQDILRYLPDTNIEYWLTMIRELET